MCLRELCTPLCFTTILHSYAAGYSLCRKIFDQNTYGYVMCYYIDHFFTYFLCKNIWYLKLLRYSTMNVTNVSIRVLMMLFKVG